jgi:hypothetical protein
MRVQNLDNATYPMNDPNQCIQRLWFIDQLSGTSSATLAFQWNGGETGGSFNPDGTNLKIGHWTGSTWTTVDATYDPNAPSGTSNAPFSSFSPFSVGVSNGILPIKLLHFGATVLRKQVQLDWSTASEQNNAYFEIQRSPNGVQYEDIGRMTGAGTSSEKHDYIFTDTKPLKGIGFYRLKQVDSDGAFSYSPVVSVTMGSAGGFLLAPMPASDKMQVKLETSFSEEGNWQLYDLSGRLVKTGSVKAESDAFTIDVSDLAEGSYVIMIAHGAEVMTRQFQK